MNRVKNLQSKEGWISRRPRKSRREYSKEELLDSLEKLCNLPPRKVLSTQK